jgi:hypothetical protein
MPKIFCFRADGAHTRVYRTEENPANSGRATNHSERLRGQMAMEQVDLSRQLTRIATAAIT